jgi:hypothetical protein
VADEDFLVETKVRYLQGTAPQPADPAIAGILVYFSQYDCLYWTAGQERLIGLNMTNLLLERSGANNIAHGYVPDLYVDIPVALRVGRRCDTYAFFYKGELDPQWTLAATYATPTPPTHVGLIMKTWGGGSTFTVDFDYFSYVNLGGTVTPEDCTNGSDDDGDAKADCLDEDCASHPSCQVGPKFLRADPNDDGSVNITDGIYVLNFLFLGGPPPTCRESSDANDDGGVNITDGIYILNYLFLGGPDPVDPGPAGKGNPCAPDREGSPQFLGCDSYTKC